MSAFRIDAQQGVHPASTIKQNLAAIRRLFDWLAISRNTTPGVAMTNRMRPWPRCVRNTFSGQHTPPVATGLAAHQMLRAAGQER